MWQYLLNCMEQLCTLASNTLCLQKTGLLLFTYVTTSPIHNIYSLFLVERDLIQFATEYVKKVDLKTYQSQLRIEYGLSTKNN